MIFTDSDGVIKSPGFPESYYNNMECTWLIELLPGKTIEIGFESFEIEYHSTCL